MTSDDDTKRSKCSQASYGSDQEKKRKANKKKSIKDERISQDELSDDGSRAWSKHHKKHKKPKRGLGEHKGSSRKPVHFHKKRKHGSSREERKSHKKRVKKESKRKDELKHGKRDKSQPIDMGSILGYPPSKLLDPTGDYFTYHQHLWVYLYRNESRTFDDLATTEEAHRAFERFCWAYNSGKLEKGYYESTLPASVLQEAQTTRHKWSFQTSTREEDNLYSLTRGVQNQTNVRDKQQLPIHPSTLCKVVRKEGASVIGDRGRVDSMSHEKRQSWRELKERVRHSEEEFSGGPKEGRERQIEKRKEVSDRTHGASRQSNDVELNDNDLYGGESTNRRSFEDALRRDKLRNQQRQDKKMTRIAELQEKEKAKQEAMFKKLGIKPNQQKITIRPRPQGNVAPTGR